MISDARLRRLVRSDAAVALFGDLIRALLWTALGGVVVLSVAYDASLVRRMYGDLHMNDFGRFYYSARAFLSGGDMYGPTPATAIEVGSDTYHLWNMNPPHFHLLVLPLALLPPSGALLAWAALNAAALGASLHLIVRETVLRWTPSRVAWAVAAIALSSATGIIAVTGQLSFLLMLPFTLAWREARRERWNRAAVWLGLVAAIKPFLGLFGVYMLLTRRWRAAATMALAGLASFALGVAVFGWQAYASWIDVVSRVDWAFAPMNASIQGLVSRTFAPNPIFAPLVDAPGIVRPLTLAASAVIAAGTAAIAMRAGQHRSADTVFAVVTLAALLISPLGWMYYVWFLAGPLVALWPSTAAHRSPMRDAFIALAVPGLLLPLYMTTVAAHSGWTSLTLGSLYTWSLLALWCAVALNALNGAAQREADTAAGASTISH
jgi:alpha-1,2-mannosyltransferase